MHEEFETHLAKRLAGLDAEQLARLNDALKTLETLANELEDYR